MKVNRVSWALVCAFWMIRFAIVTLRFHEHVVPWGYATLPLLMHFPKLLHSSWYGGCTSHAPKQFICTLLIPIHDTPLHLLSVTANQTNSNRRNNVQRRTAATTTFRSRPATMEYVGYVEAWVIRNRSGGLPLSCVAALNVAPVDVSFFWTHQSPSNRSGSRDYRHKTYGINFCIQLLFWQFVISYYWLEQQFNSLTDSFKVRCYLRLSFKSKRLVTCKCWSKEYTHSYAHSTHLQRNAGRNIYGCCHEVRKNVIDLYGLVYKNSIDSIENPYLLPYDHNLSNRDVALLQSGCSGLESSLLPSVGFPDTWKTFTHNSTANADPTKGAI